MQGLGSGPALQRNEGQRIRRRKEDISEFSFLPFSVLYGCKAVKAATSAFGSKKPAKPRAQMDTSHKLSQRASSKFYQDRSGLTQSCTQSSSNVAPVRVLSFGGLFLTWPSCDQVQTDTIQVSLCLGSHVCSCTGDNVQVSV